MVKSPDDDIALFPIADRDISMIYSLNSINSFISAIISFFAVKHPSKESFRSSVIRDIKTKKEEVTLFSFQINSKSLHPYKLTIWEKKSFHSLLSINALDIEREAEERDPYDFKTDIRLSDVNAQSSIIKFSSFLRGKSFGIGLRKEFFDKSRVIKLFNGFDTNDPNNLEISISQLDNVSDVKLKQLRQIVLKSIIDVSINLTHKIDL